MTQLNRSGFVATLVELGSTSLSENGLLKMLYRDPNEIKKVVNKALPLLCLFLYARGKVNG